MPRPILLSDVALSFILSRGYSLTVIISSKNLTPVSIACLNPFTSRYFSLAKLATLIEPTQHAE